MSAKRRAVVVEEPAITVTRSDLYRAACARDEPCGAHKDTVDKMIERLEKQRAEDRD